MNECEKCGSNEFYEEDGFRFCFHCQTQSQGFAKEVANDENEFFGQKEIRINLSEKRKSRKKQKDGQNGVSSSWNTIEAFNEIYIGFIRDFLKIIKKNDLHFPLEVKRRFISIAMQIWFKYLRESEVAFVRNEHIEQKIKLHPASRYRDNFLLGNSSLISSSTKTSEENITIPFYTHPKSHVRGKLNLFGFGNCYSFRMIKRPKISNPQYHNNDVYSEKYKDPRYFLKKDYSIDNVRHVYTKSINRFLFSNSKEESDSFLNFINQKMLPNEKEREIENENSLNHQLENEVIVNENTIDENLSTDEFVNELNYKNLIKERMSSKSKLIDDYISFDSYKQINNVNPFSNDLITKPKILALLFIAIRMFNFNIYLSDLIRWCIDGNIRYLNLFFNFNEKREIMWIDMLTFVDYRFPRYISLLGTIRNIIIHCNLDLNLFPEPDLYNLIQRYLKDLNLPKGLISIIRKRYHTFIEHHSSRQMLLLNMTKFTEYDIIAIVAILSTLRDLFDLNGKTEDNYLLFKNADNSDRLFIWHDWLHYSKIRWNVIKAFYLNIRPSHCDTVNLDEILSQNHQMFEFYKDVEISKKYKERYKQSSHQIRFKLQDIFEQLYFQHENFEWKSQCKEIPFPSFYPLTSMTETIKTKISNTELKKLLTLNFGDKFITPYLCESGFFFHRRPFLFTDHPGTNIKQFDFSDSFRHLLEVASFLTSTQLDRFLPFFVVAERMALKDYK